LARDKLAEIAAKRARGEGLGYWRGNTEIEVLESQWRGGEGPLQIPPLFIPIRLVTILEVFTREWVAEIIDSGEPYMSRAANIVKGSLKIDFALAQALVGKQVTFGELVAHDIPVNGIGDIDRVFSQLLNEPLFEHLDGIVDRWAITIRGEAALPVMPDPRGTRSKLARLFEDRHIIVHELPDDYSSATASLADYLRATSVFLNAASQAFGTLLHGDSPLTQTGMNIEAAEKAKAAEDGLAAVLARLDPQKSEEALWAGQAAWEEYRRFHAEFRSGVKHTGHGSIAPMLYSLEIEAITRQRIEQLEWYLNRREKDL